MAWRGRLRTRACQNSSGEEVFDAGQVGQAQQVVAAQALLRVRVQTRLFRRHTPCLMSMPEVRDLLPCLFHSRLLQRPVPSGRLPANHMETFRLPR